MRVLVLRGRHEVELVDLPEPELLPGSVIVEIAWCGIGGSDLESYVTGQVPAPAWFGHEWSGRVVAVGGSVAGSNVSEYFEGERVVGAAPAPCGICQACRTGMSTHCELVVAMIVGADPLASTHGAFAERIRVDARRLQPLPEGIVDRDGAMVEPAAVATHAIARAGPMLGDLVVVVGAGTIGLLVAEIARISGAASVVAVDLDAGRRELACDLGADAAFVPGSDVGRWLSTRGHGLGADVVFDCGGTAASLAASTGVVRRGGTVITVGIGSTSDERPTSGLLAREIDLRAAVGYTVSDVRRALELLSDERLRVGPICHEAVVSLGEVGTVLNRLANGSWGQRKPMVSPFDG